MINRCKVTLFVILGLLPYLSVSATHNEYGLFFEKIFVDSTDRNFIAGDTIQLSGHILDASTDSVLRNYSKYVYFELISPEGAVEHKIKLLITDGMFSGKMPLNYDMAEGLYTLCAYTTFMRNWTSKFFFKRQLLIASPFTKDYQIDANIYDNSLFASLINRSSGLTVKSSDIKVSGNGEILASATNKNRIVYKLKDNSPIIVKVSFDNYSKYFNLLSINKQSFKINIYPEGGHILTLRENLVGLHITDDLNRGVAVNGFLMDSNGSQVIEVKTDNVGYGMFRFTPQENLKYYVLVGNKKIYLPPVENNITKLTLNTQVKDSIYVNIVGKIHPDMVLSIEHNGNVMYQDYVQNSSIELDQKILPYGLVNFKLFSRQKGLVSQRFFINNHKDLPLESLAQDIGIALNNDNFTIDNPSQRGAMESVSLCLESSRYDLDNFSGDYPIEIGGELSGLVKTERGNKPVKNATINIIAPSLGMAYTATTDENGYFEITGLDWPDNTAFVCIAKDNKGNILPNISITEEFSPQIEPLPDYTIVNQIDEYYDVAQMSVQSKTLQEIQVVAKAPLTNDELIASVLGIKSLDEKSIEERNITNYEEAIRMFPGVYVSSGKILSRKGSSSIFGGAGAGVEIWIDGVKWEQVVQEDPIDLSIEKRTLQTEMKDASTDRKIKVMTGGLLPKDLAKQQFIDMQSTIGDLSACYPFSCVKSISYVPPQSALYLSNTAAHGGGAIVIITKAAHGNSSHITSGLKVIRPLGYQ